MTTVTDNTHNNLAAAVAATTTADVIHEATTKSTAPLTTVSGSFSLSSKVDLDHVGKVEAKTLMSAEHKALGYRPPPGSLAAEAQAAAAKHPDEHLEVDVETLCKLALEDAARIAAERKPDDKSTSVVETHSQIDMEKVGEAEAKTIMSAEHKALGYRPPPGSLAAEAQAAAAKHPNTSEHIDENTLREAARSDAARIAAQRDPNVAPTASAKIDLAKVGTADAAAIESAEHKVLGYRPPPGSLAAQAQAAAAEHPNTSTGISKEELSAAGRDDALRVEQQRAAAPETASGTADSVSAIDLEKIGKEAAAVIQSVEQKALGYRPPPGSLAAEAQSAASEHPDANNDTTSNAELHDMAQADAAEVEVHRRGGVAVESTTV